jgi:hypothetical protein
MWPACLQPFLANQAGQSQSLTDQEAAECEALDTINFQYRVGGWVGGWQVDNTREGI